MAGHSIITEFTSLSLCRGLEEKRCVQPMYGRGPVICHFPVRLNLRAILITMTLARIGFPPAHDESLPPCIS